MSNATTETCKCFSRPQYHRDDCPIFGLHVKKIKTRLEITNTIVYKLWNEIHHTESKKTDGSSATYRFHITLKSGRIVSLAAGGVCRSGDDTFEVAVIENGKINYSYTGGSILGFQTEQNIIDLIIDIEAF